MKFAVILAGCGVFDGAEIHEATMALLAIDKAGSTYQCFAPDIEQHHVINHATGEEMPEKRNVLIEAARISRGNIKTLTDYNPNDFDALVIPGGFGVAKNLSSLAFNGPDLTVHESFSKAVVATVESKKPIGAFCIAPAVMAKILEGAKVTIGNDEGSVQAIQALGGDHVEASHGELVIDEKYKLVTTPCYMLDATISQIEQGATNVIQAILKM